MANDILVKVGADITDFSRKMAESNKALSNFGKANAETFDAFKKTGAAVTGAGVALAGGLGIAVKTAANFEEAMSNVKAISGATGDEFNSLRDKAMEMGAKTAFSASESADAMANLAQMGWKTDDILAGIEHTLNLAAAGNLDLADAAMIAANTINQFGLEASDAERVADVMAATASSAGTDVEEMAHALQYAGANASAAGMDIEQTAAFIGVLGDAGITGSKAGTALNAMLRDLKKNAEDGAIAVGEQTVALYDANGEMRPMPEVIADIIRATDGMTDAQRDAALSTVFGEQALGAFNAIAGQGADAVSNLASELYNAGGTAQDMADIQMDNLNGALTELGSAFEGVQIAIGTALIPAIRKVTEWLTKLADWFNGLSDSTKSAIAIFAALASAIMLIVGPLLMVIGFIPQIIAGFSTIVTVVKAIIGFLGALAGAVSLPVVLITAAVVAIAAIIFKYWDEIKEFMQATWDAILEAAIAVWDWIKDVWVNAVEAFVEIFEPLIEIMSDVWENIKVAAEAAWELIKNVILGPILLLIDLVTGNFDEMGSHLSQIWENITGAAETIWNSLIDIFSMVWEAIKQVFDNALQWIDDKTGGKFSDIIKVVSEYMDMAFGIIEDIWGYIKRTFNNALEFVKGLVTLDFGRMRNAIKDQMGNIRETISSAWNRIKSFFSGKLSEILSNLKRKFTEMVSAVREKMSEIRDKIEEMMGKAIDYLKDIDLVQVGKDIIQGLIDGIGSMASAVWDKAKGIATGIGDSIKKALDIQSPSRVLMEIGKWTSIGLADGIEDYAYLVDKASDELAESAIPDVRNIDLSYATPDGITARSLAGAVSGTVDVNSRDSAVVAELKQIRGELANQRQMIVELDGRQVGRTVTPYIDEGLSDRSHRRKAAWGGA